MKRLISLIALAGLLSGCTYISGSITYPDGTVMKGRYATLIQNRTWERKTAAGDSLKLGVNNEPVQVIVEQAAPIAAAAAKGS